MHCKSLTHLCTPCSICTDAAAPSDHTDGPDNALQGLAAGDLTHAFDGGLDGAATQGTVGAMIQALAGHRCVLYSVRNEAGIDC